MANRAASNDEDFDIRDLGVQIYCPSCDHNMVGCPNSLELAVSPTGVMYECGECAEVSQFRISYDPIRVTQVPVTWGGTF